MAKKKLSIIIPVYKGESLIVPSLIKIKSVVREITQNYELICVVDGKVDKSFDLAQEFAKNDSRVRVFGYKKNKGKGYAVRYGMKRANGDIIGFTDVGLEIDPVSLKELVRVYNKMSADIVVGSKRHPKSKLVYPAARQIVSNIYYAFVKLLFNPKVSDTQAGIKIFSREVVEGVLPRLTIDGFAFDIEVLTVADSLGFNKIYEAPIHVRMVNGGSSTLGSLTTLLRASTTMFYDTLDLFFRLRR